MSKKRKKGPADSSKKKSSKKRRGKLRAESIESRILLSGTWIDPSTGDTIGDSTAGDDVYQGSVADDFPSSGGLGNDVMYGGAGNDTLGGGSDLDVLMGGVGNDTLNGDAGADVLDGGAGDDVLSGGDGDDTLIGGGGDDQMLGDAGDDAFRFTGAQNGDVVTVDGGTETDTIDLTEFGSGTVTDNGSVISVDLGDGDSFTINYSNIENVITADTAGNHGPDANAGPDQPFVMENVGVDLDASRSDDFDGDALTYKWTQIGGPSVSLSDPSVAQPSFTSPNVTNPTTLTFSLEVNDGTRSHVDTIEVRVLPTTQGGFGADTLTGTSGDEFFLGLFGADTIDGAGGDDVLAGGSGDDTLIGGTGTDIANYSDSLGGVTVDITYTAAQATGGSGTDTLSGIEGVIGSTMNDTFVFSNPADGAVYTVDGNTGTNAIDLSSFASSAITFGDGTMAIDMGAGQSFTIDYDRIDSITFSDISATVLSGDMSQTGFTGTGLWIDGAEAFQVAVTGAGTLDIAYDKGSDTFSVTGASGVDATTSLTITDLNGTDLRVDQITIDASFGDLTTNTGVGTISLAGASSNLTGTFTIGGDLGSIDMYDLAGTLDVQGDLGTIHIVNDLDPGALLNVTGDVTTLLVDDDIGGTVVIGGDVTTFDLTGVQGGSNVQVTASVTVSGSIDTLEIDAGILSPFVIGGDLGSFIGDNLDSDLTVGGDVDSVTLVSVDPAATFTANMVVGTLVFDVNGTDHGGTYGSSVQFVFDGSVGSASTTAWIMGTPGADTVTGTAGDDLIDGLGGDDVISGGAGDDLIIGGAGTDTIDYSAAASAVTVDLTVTTAQNTGGGGTDTLTGFEGAIGSAYNDTFTFSNPVDGAVYTIDGGGGSNAINLSGYASTAVTFGDGTVTIDMGGGQSFTVDYSNVETITFGDNTATVLSADMTQPAFTGTGIWIDGGQAFKVDVTGAGTLDLSYTAATDSVSITDSTATDPTTSVVITDLNGGDLIVDTVTIDTDLGALTSNVDIGTIHVVNLDPVQDPSYTITTVTIGGGSGTLGSFIQDGEIPATTTINANVTSFSTEHIAGDLTINGDVGSLYTNGQLKETFSTVITGDVGTVTFVNHIKGSLQIDGDVTTVTLKSIHATATVAFGGDVGSITVTEDIQQDVTIAGDLDSLVATVVDPVLFPYTITASQVVGTLIFDVNSTDHGGTFVTATHYTFDGATGSTSTTAWIMGTAGDDVFSGTAGDDQIDGLAGDDVITGGAGNDTIIGGSGTDTIDYSGAASAVTVDLTDTNAQNTGGDGTDTLSGFERVIGSSGSDTFRFANPVDGATYHVDGGGEAFDRIDLSNFNESAISFGSGSVTLDMGGGESFTITYEGIRYIDLGDAKVHVTTGFYSSGFTMYGTHYVVDDDAATRIEHSGPGAVEVTWYPGSDTLRIDSLSSGSDLTTSVVITDVMGSSSVSTVELNHDLGTLTVPGNITSIDLTGGAQLGTLDLNGGAGQVGPITYDTALTTNLQVNGTVSSITAVGSSTGDVTVTGDLDSATFTSGYSAVLTANQVLGSFSIVDGAHSESGAYGESTTVTYDGSSDMLSPPATPTDIEVQAAGTSGGMSLNADGGNDAYFVADNGIPAPLTSLTIEMQFEATNTPTETVFVSYNIGSDDLLSIQFNNTGPGLELDFGTGAIALSTAIDYTAALLDGQHHSLSVTWDNSAGDWEIFIDGILVDSGSGLSVGETIPTGGTLLFGQEQDGGGSGFDPTQYFSGTFHDIRLFDDVRTSGEIIAFQTEDVPHDTANLVANWQFNNSANGVVTEAVAGNNLTLQHASGGGFTASNPSLTLEVDENAEDATVVGTLHGVDAQRDARIALLLASDPDLTYNAETGKFYKYVATGMDWSTALTNATGTSLSGVSGQLITIESAHENTIVQDILNSNGATQAYIGASDSGSEGEWSWLSGATQDEQFWSGGPTGDNVGEAYENWDGTNPNNSGGNQNVGKIFASTGLWDDVDGTATQKSIIEFDADAVLDATDALTYSIQSQTVAGAFTIDSDSGQLTVADGSLLDYETNPSQTVTVRVTDIEGNTYDEAFTIALNDVTSPVNHVPEAQSVNEDTALVFGAGNGNLVSISEAGVGDLIVTVEVNDGTLTLSGTTGLTIVAGANGSSSMTITGTQAAINTALDGMTFMPDADFSGAVSLDITTQDHPAFVGHYTFNDPGNPAVDDALGGSADGLVSGAVSVNDATRGDVLSFDGIDDGVQITGLMGNRQT